MSHPLAVLSLHNRLYELAICPVLPYENPNDITEWYHKLQAIMLNVFSNTAGSNWYLISLQKLRGKGAMGGWVVERPFKVIWSLERDLHKLMLVIHNQSNVQPDKIFIIFMLTLESRRFLVLGEVSFCIRTLPNCKRNQAKSYYYIVWLI